MNLVRNNIDSKIYSLIYSLIFSLIYLIPLLQSNQALATPGDIGCSAQIQNRKVDVVVGRDAFDKPPAFIQVRLDGKQVEEFRGHEVMSDDSVLIARNQRGSIRLQFSAQKSEALLSLDLPRAQFGVVIHKMTCDF